MPDQGCPRAALCSKAQQLEPRDLIFDGGCTVRASQAANTFK